MSEEAAESPPVRPRRALRIGLYLLVALVLSGVSGAAAGRVAQRDLPSVRQLENWKPATVTQIFAADGSQVALLGTDKRILLRYPEIPRNFIDAIVATEDSRFWSHSGVDLFGLSRAVIGSIRSARLGAQGGGSTLTMQLARNLFPHIANPQEKTVRRKVQEILLALEIERTYSKDEILTFYCNQIYMGPRRYGIEAASQFYFGKPAREMSLDEAALLAGIVQNPAGLSPFAQPDRAIARRRHVLRRMVEEKMISEADARAASEAPLRLAERGRQEEKTDSYFIEEVRRRLVETYGEDALYRDGLRVTTTLDPRLQRLATEALRNGLLALQGRRGWLGTFPNIADREAGARRGRGTPSAAGLAAYRDPSWEPPPQAGAPATALVTSVDSTRALLRVGAESFELTGAELGWSGRQSPAGVFRPGDLVPVRILSREAGGLEAVVDPRPEAEGAVVVLDPATGRILALVGGFDFARSEFDRAVQARRQPGSAFKPFVIAAAIEAGLTPAERLRDEPTVFLSPGAPEPYQPENYYREYGGLVTLRETLEESRNIATVRLLARIGPEPVIEKARAMGIGTRMSPFPSLALGAFEVSPLELTAAFGVLPNQGIWVEPHMVLSVEDAEGRQLESALPESREALSPATAYVVTHMLRGVVESGTAQRALALRRDIAGKTGTTDDYTDAWFVGFSPSLACGVWIGLDRKETLGRGEAGARAALPVWIEFMEGALADRAEETFPRPGGISFVPVDRRTGLRATPESGCPPESVISEAFLMGTEVLGRCSAAEHFRLGLPYFLQRFPVNDRLELAPDVDELADLMRRDRASLRLAPDGRKLEVTAGGRRATIPLALGPEELARLAAAAAVPVIDTPPVWFGTDGRPAEIVEFR